MKRWRDEEMKRWRDEEMKGGLKDSPIHPKLDARTISKADEAVLERNGEDLRSGMEDEEKELIISPPRLEVTPFPSSVEICAKHSFCLCADEKNGVFVSLSSVDQSLKTVSIFFCGEDLLRVEKFHPSGQHHVQQLELCFVNDLII